MGGGAKVTQKLNSMLDSAGSLLRFIMTLISALGAVGVVLFWPVNARINKLENQIITLEKDIKEKLEKDIKEKIEAKADNALVEIKLKGVEEKLSGMDKKLDRIEGWFMRGNRP